MAAKTKEKYLWQWLAKCRKDFGTDLNINRIENGSGLGMPDTEGFLHWMQPKSGQFWIELKTIARPVRLATKLRPKFQPEQPPWLKRRCALGGKAWVLLQIGMGAKADRFLVSGKHAEELQAGVTWKRLREIGVAVKTPREVILAAL